MSRRFSDFVWLSYVEGDQSISNSKRIRSILATAIVVVVIVEVFMKNFLDRHDANLVAAEKLKRFTDAVENRGSRLRA